MCQTILDSLLYCKARLQLKSAKVEEILELLVLCKKSLMQLLNHEQTIQLIENLTKLRRGGDERSKMFKDLHVKMSHQSRYIRMAIRLLTVCGSLLSHLGEFAQCEQCYCLYIAIRESVDGNNSLSSAQCYFWLAQFYAEEPYCIDKVKACFLKCKEIHEYHYGPSDVRVGDCLFNLGLAYKKNLLLPQAQMYISDALKIYQEGVGLRSMPVANALVALGKIALLQGFQIRLALRYFEESLQVKQEILKNKPKSNELNALQLLIWGTKQIKAQIETGTADVKPMSDMSIMSEGHHMEIKELESILKTEFNEEALEKALHADTGNNAES